MDSLVERAKKANASKRHASVSDEDVELLLAWVKKEVTTLQCCEALWPGMKDNVARQRCYVWVSLAFREAWDCGRIVEGNK